MQTDDPIRRIVEVHLQLLEQRIPQALLARKALLDARIAVALPRPAAPVGELLRPAAGVARPVAAGIVRVLVCVVGIERGLVARRQGLGGGQVETVGRRLVVATRRRGLADLGTAVAGREIGFLALQQGVLLELPFHVRRQVEVRKLQQLDRLLQLRRHDQRLALSKL